MRCAVSLPFVYLENAIMLKQSLIAVSFSLSAPIALATDPTPPAMPQPAPVASAAPSASVAKADPDYRAGSVVTVYQLQEQGRNGYQQGQPIGSFVNEVNPWSLGLHKLQAELAFFQGKPLGYEADAYFVAKGAGNYSFAAEVELPPAVVFTDPDHLRGSNSGWIECRYRLTVAGENVIDMEVSTRAKGTRGEDRACGLTQHGFGTIQLAEGLHKARQWLACAGERRLTVPSPQFVYPVGCPNAGKRFTTDNFPGDEARVTVRVRHPQENAPVLVKTAELVHEKR